MIASVRRRLDERRVLPPVQDAEDAFAIGDLFGQPQQRLAVDAQSDSQAEQRGPPTAR